MMMTIRITAVVALAATCGGCWTGAFDNPGPEYLHRSDTITLSAGNAQHINATTQAIDPWPRRVANRRIPANGERMSHAIDRYKSGATSSSSSQGGPQFSGTPAGAATSASGPSGTPAQ